MSAIPVRTILFSCLVLAVFLAVPVLIGVYVYRDASRRRMHAVLWTLIAVLAPAFIGFIIYLLVRGGYSDLECPRCGAPVTEQYVVCPQCGVKLRPACPSCSGPVEPGWKVCPRCAAPLDGVRMTPSPPLRRQDKALSRILIVLIAAPVLLIVLTVFSLSAFQTVTGSSTLQEVTFDEYDQLQTSETARGAVHQWLDALEIRDDRAYALRYDYSNDLVSGCSYYYLIYVPAGGQQSNSSFGTNSGLFGLTFEINLERTGYSGSLFCAEVQTDSGQTPNLNVTLDGKRIRCDVTAVDYNPTLFFIMPDYSQAGPEDDIILPERLSVVKLVGGESMGTADDGTGVVAASKNEGVRVVTDEDMILKILACIDSGERVPMNQIPDFDFRDGFEIIVEYQIHDELIMHEDMARHLVFMEAGMCYLDDDRVRSTLHGSSFRVMDKDFYQLLDSLF